MKKIIRYISILLVLSFSLSTSFAGFYDINPATVKAYNLIYQKASKGKIDGGLSFLKSLQNSLEGLANLGNIDSNNAKNFYDLLRLNNEKIFELEMAVIERNNRAIINAFDFLKDFQVVVYNNDYVVKENGVWYTYMFDGSYVFNNIRDLTKANLEYNKVDSKSTLIFVDENNNVNFVFAEEYKKIKLVSNDVIYGFPNKLDLLRIIIRDKTFYTGTDYDKKLKEIEQRSLALTEGVYKTDDKIAIVYDYILKNLQYPNIQNLDITNYRLFSGVEAFDYGIAVCEGYVELFSIMLGFNLISSQIIIGDVIDTEQFPEILHAWVRVGNYYYDPTFDDPIGAKRDKEPSEYMFYMLPRDLFYVGRFDLGQTPEYFRTMSLEDRQKVVKNELEQMYLKYKDYGYKIFELIGK